MDAWAKSHLVFLERIIRAWDGQLTKKCMYHYKPNTLQQRAD